MSQFSPAPITPPRTRHKATGPYSDLVKPKRARVASAYHAFKRQKRQELLAQQPNLTSNQLAQAIATAWNLLPASAKRASPALQELTPSPLPAKTTRVLTRELDEAETGQSDSVAGDQVSGLLARLGGTLKKVASFFLVRPF